MAIRYINNVLVIGLGKVGSLVATLLQESGFLVTGLDNETTDQHSFPVLQKNVTHTQSLKAAFKGKQAVVSCLPYHLNLKVAKAAYKAGIHYFDLTEDVKTMEYIKDLSRTSSAVQAPQCGLAPGYIAIVGASLAKRLNKLRSIELRVGALPQHPKGEIAYAFNWSAAGVVNEYLNDCHVIQDGEIKTVPPMQDIESIVIQGHALEAFTTSGGLGTMCETYKGKVDTLNYKTMRYPGHCKQMRVFFNELLMKEDPLRAGEILINAKPPVNEDVVYVHAAVEGWKKQRLCREEFVEAYYPKEINGTTYRAISWTTAASVCAVVELVAKGALPHKGFIKQEEIPLDAFLTTMGGKLFINIR